MAQRVEVRKAEPWGIAPDGSLVECFRLKSETVELELVTYGARVALLTAPDRNGTLANVVLGHAALTPYLSDKAYLGCTVGRFANRIASGRFALEGATYQLDVNDPPNTLHGGRGSLAYRNWSARVFEDGVEFRIVSEDGDQGFPGEMTVVARYSLAGNRVTLEYEASTTATTVINLTNHAYFNLAGEGSPTILDHVAQIEAEQFLPIDSTAIPLGARASVAETPFDFRTPRALGERIHQPDAQLLAAGGYDHNFVLSESPVALRQVASVLHPGSGRKLSLETTEPGLQLYSGNYLDGTVSGRSGAPYGWRSGFCMETQHWPDSPNRADFPSTLLRPGEVYRSTTAWTLGTE